MIKHFFAAITGNVISLIGTLMIVLSLLLIGALLIMQAMGFEGGAYLGIVTFVVLPMMFLARRLHRPARHLAAEATRRESGRRGPGPSVTCRSSTSTRKARAACCSASWRWRCRSSRSRQA